MKKIEQEVELHMDPLETLKRCEGYYECPRGDDGKRLGPLVAYRGTYEHANGRKMRFVGDVYFNFAQAEQYPHILEFYARRLAVQLTKTESDPIDVVVGAPMGGIKLSGEIGRLLRCRAIYADKLENIILFGRHEIRNGDRVLLVEDVCNNFFTTAALCRLVEMNGGKVVAVACAFNRAETAYWQCDLKIPFVTTLHIPMVQYRQEQEKVCADIKNGNVIWGPKERWAELQAFMRQHSPAYQK